jgi:hypothetical protein
MTLHMRAIITYSMDRVEHLQTTTSTPTRSIRPIICSYFPHLS